MQLVEQFYQELFKQHPEFEPIFTSSPYRQNAKFKDMMDILIRGLKEPTHLIQILRDSGNRHAGYGVNTDYYSPVGAILIDTIHKNSTNWSPELEQAWGNLLGAVVGIMTNPTGK